METNEDVQPTTNDEQKLNQNADSLFRRRIGELFYLSGCTRSDITFSV